jgi:hypothetical protein
MKKTILVIGLILIGLFLFGCTEEANNNYENSQNLENNENTDIYGTWSSPNLTFKFDSDNSLKITYENGNSKSGPFVLSNGKINFNNGKENIEYELTPCVLIVYRSAPQVKESCDLPITETAIIGKWKDLSSGQEIEFFEDGKYKGTVTNDSSYEIIGKNSIRITEAPSTTWRATAIIENNIFYFSGFRLQKI